MTGGCGLHRAHCPCRLPSSLESSSKLGDSVLVSYLFSPQCRGAEAEPPLDPRLLCHPAFEISDDRCHLLGLKMIGSDAELLRYITGKVRLGAGKNITFCILRAHS
ncbi:unnamed protein product [Musa banksii]